MLVVGDVRFLILLFVSWQPAKEDENATFVFSVGSAGLNNLFLFVLETLTTLWRHFNA